MTDRIVAYLSPKNEITVNVLVDAVSDRWFKAYTQHYASVVLEPGEALTIPLGAIVSKMGGSLAGLQPAVAAWRAEKR